MLLSVWHEPGGVRVAAPPRYASGVRPGRSACRLTAFRVVVDPVVGDFQVVCPAVDEDAAAALGAVGDAQAVDARRVAVEVARERIGAVAIRSCWLVSRVVPAGKPASAPLRRDPATGGVVTPFAKTVMPAPSYAPIRVGSCNCSARLPLIVVSQPRMPSSGMRSTCGCSRGTGERPGGIVRMVLPIGLPIRAPIQTGRLTSVRQGSKLARGMGTGVDDAGGSSDALQPDRLPHEHHLVVGTSG